MLGYFIAIRNLAIAIVLAWIGISFSPPKDDAPAKPETPESTSLFSSETLFRLG